MKKKHNSKWKVNNEDEWNEKRISVNIKNNNNSWKYRRRKVIANEEKKRRRIKIMKVNVLRMKSDRRR